MSIEIRPRLGLRNLWRAVVPATVCPAGHRKVQRPKFPPRVCDGPSHLWRSVLPFRYEVQRVDFQYQNFRISKCFGTIHPRRSVVGSIVSACFSRNKICCSKRLNRSLQYRIIYTHNIEIIPKRDIYSKACKVTLKRCYAYAITNISQ